MRPQLKNLLKAILIIIGAAFFGMFLLMAVYFLPTSKMKDHVMHGADIYSWLGSYPEMVDLYETTRLDLQTDAIMFQAAICPVKSVTDALAVPNVHVAGWAHSEVNSLLDYVNDAPYEELRIRPYARYWHGYLVFFKPFLTFFNLSDMLIFNMIFQTLLWVLMIMGFYQKGLKRFIPALFAFIVVMHPFEISYSFQITDCFVITALTVLAMFHFENSRFVQDNDGAYLFLLAGICTAYMDLLTYPVVTLGIPLSLWILLREEKQTLKDKMILTIKDSAYWGGGYLGMFFMKWLLASVILGENIFANAIGEAQSWVSTHTANAESGGIRRFDAIRINVMLFAKWTYIAAAIFVLIWILRDYFSDKCRTEHTAMKHRLNSVLPLLLISTYPFLWYMLASSHSYVHPRLAYRELSISFFAIYAAAVTLAGGRRQAG